MRDKKIPSIMNKSCVYFLIFFFLPRRPVGPECAGPLFHRCSHLQHGLGAAAACRPPGTAWPAPGAPGRLRSRRRLCQNPAGGGQQCAHAAWLPLGFHAAGALVWPEFRAGLAAEVLPRHSRVRLARPPPEDHSVQVRCSKIFTLSLRIRSKYFSAPVEFLHVTFPVLVQLSTKNRDVDPHSCYADPVLPFSLGAYPDASFLKCRKRRKSYLSYFGVAASIIFLIWMRREKIIFVTTVVINFLWLMKMFVKFKYLTWNRIQKKKWRKIIWSWR